MTASPSGITDIILRRLEEIDQAQQKERRSVAALEQEQAAHAAA